jgi:hypothetical protein
MIWERRGAYALACGDYIIGSYSVRGTCLYVLWHHSQRVSHHTTSAEARAAAHQHHTNPRPPCA